MFSDTSIIDYIGIAVICIYFGLKYLILYISSKKDKNIKAYGIITKIEVKGAGHIQRTHTHVTFEFNDKLYDGDAETFFRNHKEGDEVTVVVNPKIIGNESKVLVVEDCKLILPILLLSIGFLFAVLTYILFIKK